MSALFPTERFINSTTNTSPSVSTANIQKQSKYGQRGGLLLAQIVELLPSELPRCDRIAGLLKEELLSARDKGMRGGIEGIEILAKTQPVKLFAPFLKGLGERGSDAAALVAQQAQQATAAPRNSSGI